jgi:hypothetical protein
MSHPLEELKNVKIEVKSLGIRLREWGNIGGRALSTLPVGKTRNTG